jgi:hypothetical protein
MRAHGISNLTDPNYRGHVKIGLGTGVDMNTPGSRPSSRCAILFLIDTLAGATW